MIGPIDFKLPIKLDHARLARLASAQEAEIEICNGCSAATSQSRDGVSYCPNCRCVEGETRMVTEAEYERLNT